MNPNLNIRKATLSDAPFIIESQILMARETEKMELDPPTVKKGVEAVFHDPHIGDYYVAESDGKLVACMLTLPEWSDWRNGKVLWIHSVYVLPEFRKSGVFAKMYEHLKQMVLSLHEYRGLRLYVDKSNTRAQKVYDRLGMNKEHYEMYEWMK